MNFCVDTPAPGFIHLQLNHFSSIFVLIAEIVCEISSYCLVLHETIRDRSFVFPLPFCDQWTSGHDFKDWCSDSFSQHDGRV